MRHAHENDVLTSVLISTPCFLSVLDFKSQPHRVRFGEDDGDFHPVGMLYYVLNRKIWDCQNGPDRNASTKEKRKRAKSETKVGFQP